jgi:hypothetical protein
MARTCQNCGQKLRARDKYCSECGVPVGTIAAALQAQAWEFCEVLWSARGFLANDKSYFWAQDMVTGDEVSRSTDTFQAHEVTETRAYPTDDRRTRAVLGELTDLLKEEGWEPLKTSGSGWWNQRFRRKIVG